MKLSAEKFAFFLHCTVTQQSSKSLFLKQNTTWKQVIRFFIEYGTVARLEERTEHCIPALWATQFTKTICHCTLAVAFKLELIKQARSQLILILVRYTQLNIFYFTYKRDPTVAIISNLFHR